MRTLYLLTIIYIGLSLTSCSSMESPAEKDKSITTSPITPAHSYHKKSPLKVAFYTKGEPNHPYKVIGQETVSKFNSGGIKRQEAHIRDGMRQLAAAMGG